MMNNFLEYALRYAEMGWWIFPIVPGQKVPATKHGVKDATTDLEQIKEWWTKNPNYNIAVACGRKSGIYVIDVDVSADGSVNGYESLKEFPILPGTVVQNTPRGGFHAFFQTQDPPANRNNFRPGIDIRGDGYYVVITPSIHPNGGKYEWTLSFAPWEHEFAEFPDFMRPVIRAPWMTPPVRVQRTAPVVAPEGDTEKRASLYLAACDPAVQGQGGHDKLLWAAVALIHGFSLSDAQAYDLLVHEYNHRCDPPWDLSLPKEEKDFRRKVSEARKLTPENPPGWLLNDIAYAPIDLTDLEESARKLISNSQIKSISIGNLPELSQVNELHFLTQPTGFLGELCSWLNSTALRKQPILSLGCALAFCGVLFGRKIRDEGGLRTNLYCMGIGESSSGKAHAPDQIRSLCEVACCVDLLGGDDFTSDSAIESRLEAFPATLFLLDEVGHLLLHIRSKANQYLTRVVPQLMKLYSAARNIYKGREYTERGKQRILIQPCCSIYGSSTPTRFSEGISPDELQDGWLSRCLVFNTQSKPPKTRGLRDTPPPREICDKVSAWFMRQVEPEERDDIKTFARHQNGTVMPMPPSQIVVPTKDDANRIFYDFDSEADVAGKTIPHFACLWDKAEENARKIALILAASESFDNPIITASIADYSCRLIRYLLIDFKNTMADAITVSLIDSDKQKLLKIVKEAGVKGCKQSILTRRSQWVTDKRRREAMLADLIEAEEIVRQIKEDKKAFFYWTIDNFLLHMQENQNGK